MRLLDFLLPPNGGERGLDGSAVRLLRLRVCCGERDLLRLPLCCGERDLLRLRVCCGEREIPLSNRGGDGDGGCGTSCGGSGSIVRLVRLTGGAASGDIFGEPLKFHFTFMT